MTTTSKVRQPLNGVDTPTLFATLDAVKANPGLAKFQFRATNEWISGTHNRSTIRGFYGAGQEDSTRTADFTYDADHPAVLVGTGNGPTPVEFLLHAIAACLTAGIANVAADPDTRLLVAVVDDRIAAALQVWRGPISPLVEDEVVHRRPLVAEEHH